MKLNGIIMSTKNLFGIYFLSVAICFIATVKLQAQSFPSVKAFKLAADYSHSQHGTGVLAMVRGKIIFEAYPPDWNANKPHLLASGTKSFLLRR